MHAALIRTAGIALAAALTGAAAAGGEGWTDNVKDAMKTAKDDQKDLLMDFTGSDWCGWCIRLHEEVFSQEAFKSFAPEHFVLVELDFPQRKPQTEELKKQNEEWRDKFNVEGYPTIALTDAEGRPYAFTGYRQGGAEAYVDHLEELLDVRVARDKAFAAAEEAEGLEKARHLDEGLRAMDEELAHAHYDKVIAQIIELDPQDEAGLKSRYEAIAKRAMVRKQLQQIMQEGMSGGNAEDLLKRVDALIEEASLEGENLQQALVMKAQLCFFVLNDKKQARKLLEEAIKAAPDTEVVPQLKQILETEFNDD